jgi:hydrogenase maturation protease
MIVRVIGVGQAERGDDAAGLHVAELLRARAPEGIAVLSGAADAAAVLAQLEGADAAVAVDCARGGDAPGSILRLPADIPLWPRSRTSSHGHALADALALGAALGCLPKRLAVFVVVGRSFGLGEPLSPAVRQALPELARLVLREVGESASQGIPGESGDGRTPERAGAITRPPCPASAECPATPASA